MRASRGPTGERGEERGRDAGENTPVNIWPHRWKTKERGVARAGAAEEGVPT